MASSCDIILRRMTDPNCIFCKIVAREISSQKEFEDETVLAFRDIHPIAPTHILIIPKKHISSLADTEKEDIEILGKIQFVAKNLAHQHGINNAFRLLLANGAPAGQAVFHLHYHLIGGWKNPPVMETR